MRHLGGCPGQSKHKPAEREAVVAEPARAGLGQCRLTAGVFFYFYFPSVGEEFPLELTSILSQVNTVGTASTLESFTHLFIHET